MTLVIAHRRESASFPENTLSVFRTAVGGGADMCEVDVQAARDGRWMRELDKVLVLRADEPRAMRRLVETGIDGIMEKCSVRLRWILSRT